MKWTLDEISDLVGHRRYCFVVMAYRSGNAFFERLRSVLEDQCNLRCIRADDIPASGEILMVKVHQLIENCELVIADLSEARANLYYEVGYAKAKGKRVLVIRRKKSKLAVDLHGLECLEYEDTKAGSLHFEQELMHHIAAVLESERGLLRQMLVGLRSCPSYLLASPRWHTARTVSEETRGRRTYGDYLGVVGIVSAFGALLGQEAVPELISAKHPDPELVRQDCNLYLIGSPRANDLTEDVLTLVQGSNRGGWRFINSRPDSCRSALIGVRGGAEFVHEADHSEPVPEDDYGIIVRGPHPDHEGRMIMVIAGTRSLGTGGACLAATRPRLIQQIRDRLKPVPLDDRQNVIWALIRSKPDPKDNHTSIEYVTVEDVGVVG